MKKIRKALATAGRVALATTPYLGVGILALVAHPVSAAVGGAALPGITTGTTAIQGSLQLAGGALAIGGLAMTGVHFLSRQDDWAGLMSRLGAAGAGTYIATQAVPISGALGAGASF